MKPDTNWCLLFFVFCLSTFSVQAQIEVQDSTKLCMHRTSGGKTYHLSWQREALIAGTGIGLYAAGIILKHNVKPATEADILALDRDDVNWFDRGGTDNSSSTAESVSDIVLFTSVAVPFITYMSEEMRHEGIAIGIMALETYLINDGITNILKGSVKRYRPFAYNPIVPLEEKLTRNSRVSFISGHASNVTAMSFFSAKVITDLYPEIKNKGLVWGLAATVPAVVSYLRYAAGKHFLTDVISGYAVGAAVGLLVPTLHMTDNTTLGIGYNRSLRLTVALR